MGNAPFTEKIKRFWVVVFFRGKIITVFDLISALGVLLFSKLYKFFFVLFVLMLNVPVNSYGHVGTVSSPNHTFILSKLD